MELILIWNSILILWHNLIHNKEWMAEVKFPVHHSCRKIIQLLIYLFIHSMAFHYKIDSEITTDVNLEILDVWHGMAVIELNFRNQDLHHTIHLISDLTYIWFPDTYTPQKIFPVWFFGNLEICSFWGFQNCPYFLHLSKWKLR